MYYPTNKPEDKGKQVVTFSHAMGSPECETHILETLDRNIAEAWAYMGYKTT